MYSGLTQILGWGVNNLFYHSFMQIKSTGINPVCRRRSCAHADNTTEDGLTCILGWGGGLLINFTIQFWRLEVLASTLSCRRCSAAHAQKTAEEGRRSSWGGGY